MIGLFTPQQLQALDFLLKMISEQLKAGCDLKPVVEFGGQLWHGDFVKVESTYIKQIYIDRHGDLEAASYHVDRIDDFKAITSSWKQYRKDLLRFIKLANAENTAYLHNDLVKLIISCTTGEETSVLHPYLYNAKSIDGKTSLPFIDLTGERIRLVSIVRISH